MSLACDAMSCTEGQADAYEVQLGVAGAFVAVVRLCPWHARLQDDGCQHQARFEVIHISSQATSVRAVCRSCGHIRVSRVEVADA